MAHTLHRHSTVRLARRIVVSAVLVLGCGLADASAGARVPTAAAAADASASKLACDQPNYDFGERNNNMVVEHVFVLRNTGGSPLVIKELKPSCGCAVASLKEQTIAPGGRADVRATIALDDQAGPLHKDIVIVSNDPANPEFSLWFHGFVSKGLDITPGHVAFGTFRQGDLVSRDVVIDAGETGGFEILRAESSLPLFAADVASRRDLMEHRVTVRTTDLPYRGAVEGAIRLDTDSENYPELYIAVSGQVVTDVFITPQTLFLTEGDAPATKYIAIRQAGGHPFRVLEIELPDSGIDAQIVPLGNEGCRIRLNNVAGYRALDHTLITIRTDLTGAEKIEIPLRVLGAESGGGIGERLGGSAP